MVERQGENISIQGETRLGITKEEWARASNIARWLDIVDGYTFRLLTLSLDTAPRDPVAFENAKKNARVYLKEFHERVEAELSSKKGTETFSR